MIITVENVMHVIDVHVSRVDKATIQWLENERVDYRDQVAKEHLINIAGIEDEDLEEVLPIVRDEVIALQVLARVHEAGYVRFIS